MKNQWAIVDLDGTLCDIRERVHFAHAARQEADPVQRAVWWDKFHSFCLNDAPHVAEVTLMLAWQQAGGRMAFLTGRTDRYRDRTQRWLTTQGLPQTPLIMRDNGNYQHTTDYKAKKLEVIKSIIGPEGVIAFVLEDNDKLVAMWRQMGYTCLQPRPSSY
jgi:hypothetical protein